MALKVAGNSLAKSSKPAVKLLKNIFALFVRMVNSAPVLAKDLFKSV